jgi:hypothetical protein
MYASLDEWSTGKRVIREFSASSYVDVYRGNLVSLEDMQVRKNAAYNELTSWYYNAVV